MCRSDASTSWTSRLRRLPGAEQAAPLMPRYFDLQHGAGGRRPRHLARGGGPPAGLRSQARRSPRVPTERPRAAVVVTDVWLMNQELGDFFPRSPSGSRRSTRSPSRSTRTFRSSSRAIKRSSMQMADEGKRAALLGHGSGIDERSRGYLHPQRTPRPLPQPRLEARLELRKTVRQDNTPTRAVPGRPGHWGRLRTFGTIVTSPLRAHIQRDATAPPGRPEQLRGLGGHFVAPIYAESS